LSTVSPQSQRPLSFAAIAGQAALAPTTGYAIRLVNVARKFGPQVVLDGVNINIPRGQTTVIMGPSGCGKSVMLKHIVGLLQPTSGEVWIEDQRIDQLRERDLRPIRLQIGFLFQLSALFDSMSVADNIAFPLIEHTTLTPSQRRDKIHHALELVDLDGVESKLPAQLSGGQRKRVALARAIVLEPRIILYDEPTTGLDPIRSDGIDQLVNKLRKELGITSVVVTHDMNSARKVAEHCFLLLNGKVAAQGTFEQLQQNPDFRVQQFLQGVYRRDDIEAERPSSPGQAASS
jgi:phospholipid/cholesterol/gamma-HCH transport system ATP-binding protein